MSDAVRVGFFGKLPAFGDFVRRGLSREVVDTWDGWLQAVLPVARNALDGAGDGIWMRLRPSRFAFAPGLCGPAPITGVWLPSIDRVGRPFPLLLAAEAAAGHEQFLDAAQTLGEQAVGGRLAPDGLAECLRAAWCRVDLDTVMHAPKTRSAQGARWWRYVVAEPVIERAATMLPDAEGFLAMLAL